MTLHDRIIDTLYELADASIYTLARIMHSHDFVLLQRTCVQMTEEGILVPMAPEAPPVRDVRYRLTEYGATLFVAPLEKRRGVSSRTIKSDIRSKQERLARVEESVLAMLRRKERGRMATLFEMERELGATVAPCVLSSTNYELLYCEKLYRIGPVSILL